MGYWDWYYTGDGNPERTKMKKAIEGKDPKDMTEYEYAFYKAEQARKRDKLEREAARMQDERKAERRKQNVRLGLDPDF